jgi:hypothetical protein
MLKMKDMHNIFVDRIRGNVTINEIKTNIKEMILTSLTTSSYAGNPYAGGGETGVVRRGG